MVEKLPAEYVRECLDYNPETGIFRWKFRDDIPQYVNAQYEGKVAGQEHSEGYRVICIKYQRYFSHRLAWLLMTGEWPKDEIDHIDCNRKNNKWNNLREATCSQNFMNRKILENTVSGFKGVNWHKQNKKWLVRMKVNKKSIYVGCYDDIEDAKKSMIEARKKHHGEFARYV